jgi:hypothetical protein
VESKFVPYNSFPHKAGYYYDEMAVRFNQTQKEVKMPRDLLDIPIGTTVKSSDRAPVDGDWEFVEHIGSSNCRPSAKERKVYLFRGQLLPVCKRCGERGIWKLISHRFEIPPDKDNTPFVLKAVRGDRPDVPYPAGSKRLK